jgi:hypothetical protein
MLKHIKILSDKKPRNAGVEALLAPEPENTAPKGAPFPLENRTRKNVWTSHPTIPETIDPLIY